MTSAIVVGLTFLGATAAAPPEEDPSPAAVMFGQRCGGCHTLGQGDRVGPDLLGVDQRRERSWIAGFIRDPSGYIRRGDKVAKELLAKFSMEMPPQSLTDGEVGALLEYFASCTKQGGCQPATGEVKGADQATAEDIARGQRLFEGGERFSGGGPACLSCHNVRGAGILGGGTLGKDLTHVYARMGDAALSSALASTPFKLMEDVYRGRPLSKTEAFQVKAYLYDAVKNGDPARPDRNFLYAGILGLFLCLGLIGLIWSNRMRGVREHVVKRGLE